MLDPTPVDAAVEHFVVGEGDRTSNATRPAYPHGLVAEAMRADAPSVAGAEEAGEPCRMPCWDWQQVRGRSVQARVANATHDLTRPSARLSPESGQVVAAS